MWEEGLIFLVPLRKQLFGAFFDAFLDSHFSVFGDIGTPSGRKSKIAELSSFLRADPSHSVFGYISFKFEILH